MDAFRKFLYDEFCTKTLENYTTYCKENKMSESSSGIITFLIDHELIKPVTVRHYTICQDFTYQYSSSDKSKSEIVRLLSQRYNLSERSVWAVIKSKNDPKKRF